MTRYWLYIYAAAGLTITTILGTLIAWVVSEIRAALEIQEKSNPVAPDPPQPRLQQVSDNEWERSYE